jgi:predicted dithiol-disulfide oxidoreductase (DUF899 family)
MPLTVPDLTRRKMILYRAMYEFTQSQCTTCSLSGCACKDTICAHVEDQNLRAGRTFPHGTHPLRFIGCRGCVVPPQHRETCTIYLCAAAMNAPGFERARYERLKNLIARVEWRLMELADGAVPRPRDAR